MSIEGGSFKCDLHGDYETQEFKKIVNGKEVTEDREVFVGFETSSVKEWNEHCTEEGHTEEGSTKCRDCGKQITFKNLPYHPFDEQGHKNISLQCPNCSDRFAQVEMEIVS